jgi:hypothetical protein
MQHVVPPAPSTTASWPYWTHDRDMFVLDRRARVAELYPMGVLSASVTVLLIKVTATLRRRGEVQWRSRDARQPDQATEEQSVRC